MGEKRVSLQLVLKERTVRRSLLGTQPRQDVEKTIIPS